VVTLVDRYNAEVEVIDRSPLLTSQGKGEQLARLAGDADRQLKQFEADTIMVLRARVRAIVDPENWTVE